MPKRRQDPLDELIATVLSQHTSDLNSGRAFAALKARYSSWGEVLSSPSGDVAHAIRTGGIANVKARRIQRILGEVEEREGGLTLDRLAAMDDDEAAQYLESLPGVGPKTAACVLLFSLGRDAFPIDTHVLRVSARLGLIEERASAEAAHATLGPLVPPEIRYEFHMQLIRHGRETCKPRDPRCGDCAVFELCPTGPELVAAGRVH